MNYLNSILLVNTWDAGGGAERVASNLHRVFRDRGYSSWFAVGYRKGNDLSTIVIDQKNHRSRWTKMWVHIAGSLLPLIGRLPGGRRLHYILSFQVGQAGRWLRIHRGLEDFCFPATRHLLELPPIRPEMLHCHNLHGGYFDLHALPWLSSQVPTVLTLHDAWMLSGHCAHSFDCERWKSGCGYCPDLSIYPAIRRDATAYNWRQKRGIYENSRLYISTPCHWLMNRVNKSMLSAAIVESRVIPYGVDLTLFHPTTKETVRRHLGIPQHASVILFTANSIRKNMWKDFWTMRTSMERLSHMMSNCDIIFLALGEDGPNERIGRLQVRFIPHQADPLTVASYYQAADVYIHAARADTFPNTILEALACGTPVVATAVGGIPEQIRNLRHDPNGKGDLSDGSDEATGILVPQGDPESMASAIEILMKDRALRGRIGRNAAEDARKRFDLRRQADDYLKWYIEIIENW